MQFKAVLSSVGPLFCTGLGTFYLGHILWDLVQNKNAEPLVESSYEFQDGDSTSITILVEQGAPYGYTAPGL